MRKPVVPPGLVFDLVAAQADTPFAVMDLKHATYQVGQYDQLHRFIERLRQVRKRSPSSIGCFIVDGAVDKRLNELVSVAEVPVFLFNLADPDYAEQIGTEVSRQLAAHESHPATGQADERPGGADREDSAMSALLAEIEKVKESQVELLGQVRDRFNEQGVSGEAVAKVAQLGNPGDQLTKVYQEATKRVGPSQMLAVTLGGLRGVLITAGIVVGVAGLFIGTPLAQEFFPADAYTGSYATRDAAILTFRVIAIVLLCGGVLLLLREFIATVQYYRLRDRVLYGLYVREAPPKVLVDASLAFDSYIEDLGPIRGRREVMRDLRRRGLAPVMDDWGPKEVGHA